MPFVVVTGRVVHQLGDDNSGGWRRIGRVGGRCHRVPGIGTIRIAAERSAVLLSLEADNVHHTRIAADGKMRKKDALPCLVEPEARTVNTVRVEVPRLGDEKESAGFYDCVFPEDVLLQIAVVVAQVPVPEGDLDGQRVVDFNPVVRLVRGRQSRVRVGAYLVDHQGIAGIGFGPARRSPDVGAGLPVAPVVQNTIGLVREHQGHERVPGTVGSGGPVTPVAIAELRDGSRKPVDELHRFTAVGQTRYGKGIESPVFPDYARHRRWIAVRERRPVTHDNPVLPRCEGRLRRRGEIEVDSIGKRQSRNTGGDAPAVVDFYELEVRCTRRDVSFRPPRRQRVHHQFGDADRARGIGREDGFGQRAPFATAGACARLHANGI